MNNTKAFTFVELLIGITLSMLLMLSVWVFVTTGMKHVLFQEKIIKDSYGLSSSIESLHSLLFHSERIITVPDGMLLKTRASYDIWWYSYIWEVTKTNYHCEIWSEVNDTNHLVVKNFLPFEEVWEDINIDFTQNETSKEVLFWGEKYRTNMTNHTVEKEVSGVYEPYIGGWTYGFILTEWDVPEDVLLNTPTGLVAVWTKLVFSDTLNDRVLYFDWTGVYTLLWEKDWISEPTGLSHDSVNNILYIANSWKWEILALSSKQYSSNPDIEIQFQPKQNFSADNFELFIQTGAINLASWISKNDVTLSNRNSWSSINDEVFTDLNSYNYHFINSYQADWPQTDCTVWNQWTVINNWSNQVINCVSAWIGKLAVHSIEGYTNSQTYSVDVSGITPVLTDENHYYIESVFYTGTTEEYREVFPYFSQWDNDLFTPDNNTLEVLVSGLTYPTWIEYDAGTGFITVNDFESRGQNKYSVDWSLQGNALLAGFSSTAFNQYNESHVFKNPLDATPPLNPFEFQMQWTDLLNIKVSYALYQNCFNEDEKSIKTAIFKKKF